jgi:hypothetical protein
MSIPVGLESLKGFRVEPHIYQQTGGVMINLHSSNRVDHVNTGWLGISKGFSSGATYLPADCFFNELSL